MTLWSYIQQVVTMYVTMLLDTMTNDPGMSLLKLLCFIISWEVMWKGVWTIVNGTPKPLFEFPREIIRLVTKGHVDTIARDPTPARAGARRDLVDILRGLCLLAVAFLFFPWKIELLNVFFPPGLFW